ncbi:MAG: class I SAM-dependent methyltransferase, partial [Burkholderiales bacterium]|nr:class I SAM-dependent methyltransferase [Burkholderiales bacterium]
MDRQIIGDYWNHWQDERQRDGRVWADWGDHPRILRHLQRDLFGSAETTVFDFLRGANPAFARAHAISLCCGDGAFEKLLVEQGVFGSVVGIDLADQRVQQANERRGALADRLRYEVADANLGDFGEASRDVVFAKAALHHIAELEAMMNDMRRALRPGGHLVTLDFFGPTRFQWTDAQLGAVNDFLRDEVPLDLRRRADGSTVDVVPRPTPQEVAEMDPSEAVRSGELHAFIHRHMRVEH